VNLYKNLHKNYNNNNNNNNRTFMLMVVAISGDRSLIKKEAEKILKYGSLIIEIQNMWNMKTKFIPPITGATGTISKPLGQYLNKHHERRN
jgi:hypothetical protein